ncbi:MAG TPA: hypothetical protein VIT88_12590 [Pyrinomonadaceae bacterium]
MKRCTQCEFIYEDEQTTCDMDGAILAFDENSAEVQSQRSVIKSFAVPAIAGTGLAAVLCLAFYASPLLVAKPETRQPFIEQTSPANAGQPSTPTQPAIQMPSPSTDVVVDQTPATEVENAKRSSDENHATPKTSDSRLTIRRGLAPLPRVPTLPRLPPARVGTSSTKDNVQVTNSKPKKQSKVESFFKKTGRAITKPFKF